jgi:hypothetical protein
VHVHACLYTVPTFSSQVKWRYFSSSALAHRDMPVRGAGPRNMGRKLSTQSSDSRACTLQLQLETVFTTHGRRIFFFETFFTKRVTVSSKRSVDSLACGGCALERAGRTVCTLSKVSSVMHLGHLSRTTGAPGRGGTSLAACWAGKPATHGGVAPLTCVDYIVPDHSLRKEIDAIDNKRKRREERQRKAELAATKEFSMHGSTASSQRTTLSTDKLAPLYASRSSPTLRSLMRSSSGFFRELSWEPLGDSGDSGLKGIGPSAVRIGGGSGLDAGTGHRSGASGTGGGVLRASSSIELLPMVRREYALSDAQVLRKGSTPHDDLPPRAPQLLPVLLPHKLDYVKVAHTRSPQPGLASNSPAVMFNHHSKYHGTHNPSNARPPKETWTTNAQLNSPSKPDVKSLLSFERLARTAR